MENAFFFNFSGNFWVLWGVLKNSWLEIYKQLSCKCVCKYLNQRVRIARKVNRMENSFEGVSKTNKKPPKKLSFISQFKMEIFKIHNPQRNKNHWDTRQLCNICSILFLIYSSSSDFRTDITFIYFEKICISKYQCSMFNMCVSQYRGKYSFSDYTSFVIIVLP